MCSTLCLSLNGHVAGCPAPPTTTTRSDSGPIEYLWDAMMALIEQILSLTPGAALEGFVDNMNMSCIVHSFD